MPWLGDDDVLSRAEAGAGWAWRALLAAAAEDVRAILAGEALACKRSRTCREARKQAARPPPPYAPLPTESPADSARTLFFDEAEAGAVAAEELRTTDTSSRGPQHSRLHGSSRRNDCA